MKPGDLYANVKDGHIIEIMEYLQNYIDSLGFSISEIWYNNGNSSNSMWRKHTQGGIADHVTTKTLLRREYRKIGVL